MYFLILKGGLGKEVFLVDIEGLSNATEAFDSQKDYKFLAYNPEDLDEAPKFVFKKHSTVAHIEFRDSGFA